MDTESHDQIIDRAYNLYLSTDPDADNLSQYGKKMTKEEFWDLVKSNPNYAKSYGLTVEYPEHHETLDKREVHVK